MSAEADNHVCCAVLCCAVLYADAWCTCPRCVLCGGQDRGSSATQYVSTSSVTVWGWEVGPHHTPVWLVPQTFQIGYFKTVYKMTCLSFEIVYLMKSSKYWNTQSQSASSFGLLCGPERLLKMSYIWKNAKLSLAITLLTVEVMHLSTMSVAIL